jgi:hypothetical protein
MIGASKFNEYEIKCCIPAILNLGYMRAHRGYAKFEKLLKRRPFEQTFLLGGTQRAYNYDLGVRRGVQF